MGVDAEGVGCVLDGMPAWRMELRLLARARDFGTEKVLDASSVALKERWKCHLGLACVLNDRRAWYGLG